MTVFPERIASGPYLVIDKAGRPSMATAEEALRAMRRSAFIYDLQQARRNFDKLIGTRERFARSDIRTIAAIVDQTLIQWTRRGILTYRTRENERYEFDRTDAFLAGVAGALSRQHIKRRTLEDVTRFLDGVLRPEPVEVPT